MRQKNEKEKHERELKENFLTQKDVDHLDLNWLSEILMKKNAGKSLILRKSYSKISISSIYLITYF